MLPNVTKIQFTNVQNKLECLSLQAFTVLSNCQHCLWVRLGTSPEWSN